MDQIYKIGGHCFALPDERLMEVVDGISGFKAFIRRNDPSYRKGKEKYEELAFRWWMLIS